MISSYYKASIALLLTAGMLMNAIAVEKVQILGLFKDKAAVSIDGKQRLLRVGQPSPEGVTLISANSKEAVIEIEGKRARYGLGSHIGSTFTPPTEKPVVRIWRLSRKGRFTVVGSINGYPVNFLVDTGADLIAMNRNQARRLGIDYRVIGDLGWSSTASGMAKAYSVVLDRVKVGEIELTKVRAAVLDGDFPREVLLGMSFLNRLDWRKDENMIELRKKY